MHETVREPPQRVCITNALVDVADKAFLHSPNQFSVFWHCVGWLPNSIHGDPVEQIMQKKNKQQAWMWKTDFHSAEMLTPTCIYHARLT